VIENPYCRSKLSEKEGGREGRRRGGKGGLKGMGARSIREQVTPRELRVKRAHPLNLSRRAFPGG